MNHSSSKLSRKNQLVGLPRRFKLHRGKKTHGNMLYCFAFLLPDAWVLKFGTPIWKSGQLRKLSGGVLVLVAQAWKT
jgi:hypothetical protein